MFLDRLFGHIVDWNLLSGDSLHEHFHQLVNCRDLGFAVFLLHDFHVLGRLTNLLIQDLAHLSFNDVTERMNAVEGVHVKRLHHIKLFELGIDLQCVCFRDTIESLLSARRSRHIFFCARLRVLSRAIPASTVVAFEGLSAFSFHNWGRQFISKR